MLSVSVNNDVVSEYADVRRAVMHANHSQPSKRAIDRTIAHLETYLARPMRVVVLGEHNSGKTALVNAMLGRDMLPTAVIANTPVSVTVRYGSVFGIRAQSDDGTWIEIDKIEKFKALTKTGMRAVEIRAPNPLLKKFELVDTPAAGNCKSHVLGADFVIWCSNATRAWSQTERRQWMALPRRCRRYGVLALTHADTLADNADREKVRWRMDNEGDELFEDIRFVSTIDNPNSTEKALAGEHSETHVKGLLESLERMANAQRARRIQAVSRITSRLTRSVPPALPRSSSQSSTSDAALHMAS